MQTGPASDEQWKRLRADIGRLVARRVPSSDDVEDVVQEVLIRVWRHRASLRDDERFGSWLSRVAYNAVVDHLRSLGRLAPVLNEQALSEIPAGPSGPPADFEGVRELIAAVLQPFVDQLPPRYRETLTLSELEGLPHAAIAERLSLSVSGVKSRVQRGRELLKELLERCCQFALDARGAPISCTVRPDGVLPPGCCATGAGNSAEERVGCVRVSASDATDARSR